MNGPNWTNAQLKAYERKQEAQRPVVGKIAFGPPGKPKTVALTVAFQTVDGVYAYPTPLTAQALADWHNGVHRMNKTEAAYAAYLSLLGLPWQFEAIKLCLAPRTWYTPDFYLPTLAEFREVKGFWREDARVKFKAAAEKFPQWRFTAVRKAKGGGWEDCT